MKIKNVPVKVAAAMLGKAERVIRCSLVLGKLPYGVTNPIKKFCTYQSARRNLKNTPVARTPTLFSMPINLVVN